MLRITPQFHSSRVETAALRARYLGHAARHAGLRARGGQLGPGAYVRLAPDAMLQVGPGFYGRQDLTLIVSGQLRIGAGVACNRGVAIVCLHEMTIGDQVRFGERVSVLDHNHAAEPLDDLAARFDAYDVAPVSIGDRVLIGANTVILAGASVGADSVIGAGSVVVGEIPPATVAVGTPASVRRALRRHRE